MDDEYARTKNDNGTFSEVGKVHFSGEAHISIFIQSFIINLREEKIVRHYQLGDSKIFAAWNILVSRRRS